MKNYEALQYVIFFNLIFIALSVLGPKIFLSILISNVLSVLPLGCQTKFHTHSTTLCILVYLNFLVLKDFYRLWEGCLYIIKSILHLCETCIFHIIENN